MEYLAMYDISNPKRLKKVERAMRGYGYRVQKSVFECSLNQSILNLMAEDIGNIMNKKDDSFRIYPLLNNSRIKQKIIGKGDMLDFPEAFLA